MVSAPFFSIVIPTHDRRDRLNEILNEVFKVENRSVEIVVIDNCSTDGTWEMLRTLTDERLRVIRNSVLFPAFRSITNSIFLARGKYAIYCNDKDILYADRIDQLIHYLSNNEYAAVYTTVKRRFHENSFTTRVYEKGFDALNNISFALHPTGMVYNRELIRDFIENRKIELFEHDNCIYSWSLLAVDLVKYGRYCVYDFGVWGLPSLEYVKTHVAGTGLSNMWFDPIYRYTTAKKFMFHINDFYRDMEQSNLLRVDKRLFETMVFDSILNFKYANMSESEMSHYNRGTRLVTTVELLHIFYEIVRDLKDVEKSINIHLFDSNYYNQRALMLIKGSLRFDFICIKNMINHLDPYRER